MALRNCPECGHQVSDQAESCPSCGRRVQNTGKSVGLALLAIAVVLMIVAGFWHPEFLPRGRESHRAPDVGRPGMIQMQNGRVVEYDQHGHKVFEGTKEEAERHFNNRPGTKAEFR